MEDHPFLVLSLKVSLVPSMVRVGISLGARTCLLRTSIAVRHISSVKTVMVERGGKTCLAKLVSLKEMSWMSSGTLMPAS